MRFRHYINNLAFSAVPSLAGNEALEIDVLLNEAAFSQKNLEKVAHLYSKILGKKMGGEFAPISIETYTRMTGPGKGIRMMNNRGEQVRFNYDEKVGKTGKFDLTSIDYWAPKNIDFQKPTRTVMFKREFNVVQILDAISTALLSGNINEKLKTSRSTEEKEQWLISKGMPKSLRGSFPLMKIKADERGLTEDFDVYFGLKEQDTFEGDLQKTEKSFNAEVFADPETVFEDIEDLLSVVAKKQWRTLIVCGMGGVGKCLQSEQTVNIKGLQI